LTTFASSSFEPPEFPLGFAADLSQSLAELCAGAEFLSGSPCKPVSLVDRSLSGSDMV
jgi:hypothetical protein